eukprot:g1327.t1
MTSSQNSSIMALCMALAKMLSALAVMMTWCRREGKLKMRPSMLLIIEHHLSHLFVFQAQEPSVKNPLIGHFKLDDGFREVVISICLRVLSQVELDIVRDGPQQMRLGTRYVISELDWMREFIEGVSMEAVRILDLLCLMDPSLVTRIFPAVKKAFQFCGKAQRKLASC